MRRLFAAAAVLTLTACINDSIGIVGTQAVGGGTLPSSTGVPGTYTLKTVDGKPLPFTFLETATEKRETVDESFTMTTTNTWTREGHVRRTLNGAVTSISGTDAGTYSKTDQGIYYFISQNQTPFSGTVVNGVLSLTLRNTVGDYVPAIYSK